MGAEEAADAIAAAERAVCVYCASSSSADPEYRALAAELGALLARAGRTIVYGGSRNGSMGALADAALAAGGRVVGVMPGFLEKLEIAHDRLSELHIVADLHERKRQMLIRSSAVVALPGGTGTFEELLEALTLKRLGIFRGPLVICNQRGYYDPLLGQLDAAVREGFMQARHSPVWTLADSAPGVMAALAAPDA